MTEQEYEKFNEFINTTLYETMTDDDYYEVMDSLDVPHNGHMFKTCCHNEDLSHAKYNLSLYNKTFTCFSECNGEKYSLLSLVKKRFELIGESKSTIQCMKYICEVCDIPFDFNTKEVEVKRKYNWKYLKKYVKGHKEEIEEIVYDESVLNMFEEIYTQEWIDDNISIETMKKYGIKFYIYQCCIIIPCRNIDGELIGIRGRYLRPDVEHKYFPVTILDGTQFKFPTNNSIYGLWITQHAIRKHKKVVIGEAEKFTMQCDTYYGDDNFAVSLYGKAMSEEKKLLLLQLGIEEVILCLDFDYIETHVKDEFGYVTDENGDYIKTEEFDKFIKRLYLIGDYFKPFCKVTTLISYGRHKYKMTATDGGKGYYEKLYGEREELYG